MKARGRAGRLVMEYILHPRSEIDSRIKRLQASMVGLSGALIFDYVDMGYFSGTCQEGLVYIPAEGEPRLMIKKSLERARTESPLDPVPMRSLRNLKDDLGIPSAATIGIETDVLPYSNYERVARALEGVQLTDISERIKHVRSIKSGFEIRLIKEASRVVDLGIASIAENLREGLTEIELSARVESVMREAGHQGVLRFRRFNHVLPMGHLMAGPSAAIKSYVASPTGGQGVSIFNPQGPGFRKIRRNEPVLADYAGAYNGYLADETRIFSIGRVSEDLEDAHQAALDIEDAVASAMIPGRTGRELFEISEEVGAAKGYGDHLGGPPGSKAGFVGHGLGLEINEYPVIGPVDHEMKPGMTIALEPKMIYPGKGVVGIEDTYLIKDGGAEGLTMLPREIWRV